MGTSSDSSRALVRSHSTRRVGCTVALVTTFFGLLAACSSSSSNATANADATSGGPVSEESGTADAQASEGDAASVGDGGLTGDADAASVGDADSGSSGHGDAGVSDASKDAAPDAHVDAGEVDAGEVDAGEGENPRCNNLVDRGCAVALVDTVGSSSPSTFHGGTIADGTYVLTSATHYVEQGVPGHKTDLGSETIQVHGRTLQEVQVFPGGDIHRFTAHLIVNGSKLQITTSCLWASNPGARYPELGDWAPLAHDEQTGFDATSTTLTIWTPRGNHESVIRVYERVD